MAIIVLVGSVFSPYYAWSGRRDPENHCAINIGLYGPGGRHWTMTERGRSAVRRSGNELAVGPSRVTWDGSALTIDIDEVTAPIPSRVVGRVRLHPAMLTQRPFALDADGRHLWQPIAPRGRVEVSLSRPDISWSGEGYLDSNAGAEPLETAFKSWNWSRAPSGDGAAMLYHATPRTGERLALAVHCDRQGQWQSFDPPREVELPTTLWGIRRRTLADAEGARVVRTFEDGPFYARSELETHLMGEKTHAVHESVSLDRFATSWVKTLLPFRMPRAIR